MQILSRLRGLRAPVALDEPLRKGDGGGAGGGGGARQTIVKAEGSGTLEIGKSAILLRVASNNPTRIRLYTTTAARAADIARPTGTLPAQGAGCLLEFIAVPILLGADLTPAITAYNRDGTPLSVVYYLIEPTLPATTSNVTFTYITLEE